MHQVISFYELEMLTFSAFLLCYATMSGGLGGMRNVVGTWIIILGESFHSCSEEVPHTSQNA